MPWNSDRLGPELTGGRQLLTVEAAAISSGKRRYFTDEGAPIRWIENPDELRARYLESLQDATGRPWSVFQDALNAAWDVAAVSPDREDGVPARRQYSIRSMKRSTRSSTAPTCGLISPCGWGRRKPRKRPRSNGRGRSKAGGFSYFVGKATAIVCARRIAGALGRQSYASPASECVRPLRKTNLRAPAPTKTATGSCRDAKSKSVSASPSVTSRSPSCDTRVRPLSVSADLFGIACVTWSNGSSAIASPRKTQCASGAPSALMRPGRPFQGVKGVGLAEPKGAAPRSPVRRECLDECER